MGTRKDRRLQSVGLRRFLAAGAALAVGQSALAQTWNGGGADNNWTTGGNWVGGIAPLNNGTANIVFGGAVRPLPVVNTAQDILSLTFNSTAGAFTLQGASNLTIRSGGITNGDTQTQTINSPPVIVAATQTWNAASGPLSFNSPITINVATLTLDGANAITTNGAIGGIAGADIVKNGTGLWTLGGPCSLTGIVTVASGTLRTSAANVLPTLGGVSVGASGILDINGTNQSVGALGSSSSFAQVQLPGNSNLTIGSALSAAFSGTISGSSTASLTKTGSTTFAFNGISTFPGTVSVLSGTFSLGASERLADSCALRVIGATATLQLPAALTETVGTLLIDGGATVSGGGTLSAAGFGFTVGAGSTTCPLTGGTFASFDKITDGDFTLSAACTYQGSTSIEAGRLILAVNNALPSFTRLNILPGNATLQLNSGVSQSLGGLTGNGGAVVLSGSSSNLTVSVTSSDVFLGTISGPGSVTKTGSGEWILFGANTYTGTTNVNTGTLALGTESLAPTSDLVVNGGTLQIRGTSQTFDAVTLHSGRIDGLSGSPIPHLTANTLTMESGTVTVALDGPAQLFKSTAGTLVLTAPSGYLGSTRLSAGTLAIASDSVLGAPTTPLTMTSGTTLRVDFPSLIARPVIISTPATIDTAGDATFTNLSATSTGTLTKQGAARLILGDPVSVFTMAVSAGEVVIPASSSLTANSSSVAAAGAYRLDGGLLSVTGAVTNSGAVRLNSGARLQCGSITNNGLLAGSGEVTGVCTNAATGDVRVGALETLRLTSVGTFANSGLVEVLGGTLEVTGPATNSTTTGLIFARSAEVRFNGGFTNNASVGVSAGATDFFGDLINQPGAVITVSGGSDATFVDDVVNNGTIRTSAGCTSTYFGAVSGSGTFPGSGIVYLEGDLRPGNSPGLVTFGGHVVWGTGSNLVEELAGTNLNQYDRTAVAGTAYLDGALDVRLFGGYIPSGIQRFTILTANQVVGQFQTVNLPLTNPPLRVIYTDTAVLVSNCAADFNNDGVVDFFDYLDFVDAFSAGSTTADFNQDSVIDFFDYLDFVDAFSIGC